MFFCCLYPRADWEAKRWAVYIIWEMVKKWAKSGQKMVSFLPGSRSNQTQASSKVAKVAKQKVAKENQPHIVVRLKVVKVAHIVVKVV